MDSVKMEPDFSMSCVTIRSILSNKDLLSHPLKATPAGKDDTESNDMYTDATAAFLGPNIWEKTLSDFKMDYLDLDALLGNNPDEGQQKVEDCIEQNSDETVPQIQQLPPQNQPDMCLPGHMSSEPASPDSSLNDLSSDEDGRKGFSVDCKFSPTDLALATPPGQEHYDPTSAVFPEDELKPQPIIKKSRKNFVPDNLKDDKYWARRHKNNIAAKRSREARRLKENQIVLRASYLEKENNSLKEDVMRLKAENDMLKNQLKEYQS